MRSMKELQPKTPSSTNQWSPTSGNSTTKPLFSTYVTNQNQIQTYVRSLNYNQQIKKYRNDKTRRNITPLPERGDMEEILSQYMEETKNNTITYDQRESMGPTPTNQGRQGGSQGDNYKRALQGFSQGNQRSIERMGSPSMRASSSIRQSRIIPIQKATPKDQQRAGQAPLQEGFNHLLHFPKKEVDQQLLQKTVAVLKAPKINHKLSPMINKKILQILIKKNITFGISNSPEIKSPNEQISQTQIIAQSDASQNVYSDCSFIVEGVNERAKVFDKIFTQLKDQQEKILGRRKIVQKIPLHRKAVRGNHFRKPSTPVKIHDFTKISVQRLNTPSSATKPSSIHSPKQSSQTQSKELAQENFIQQRIAQIEAENLKREIEKLKKEKEQIQNEKDMLLQAQKGSKEGEQLKLGELEQIKENQLMNQQLIQELQQLIICQSQGKVLKGELSVISEGKKMETDQGIDGLEVKQNEAGIKNDQTVQITHVSSIKSALIQPNDLHNSSKNSHKPIKTQTDDEPFQNHDLCLLTLQEDSSIKYQPHSNLGTDDKTNFPTSGPSLNQNSLLQNNSTDDLDYDKQMLDIIESVLKDNDYVEESQEADSSPSNYNHLHPSSKKISQKELKKRPSKLTLLKDYKSQDNHDIKNRLTTLNKQVSLVSGVSGGSAVSGASGASALPESPYSPARQMAVLEPNKNQTSKFFPRRSHTFKKKRMNKILNRTGSAAKEENLDVMICLDLKKLIQDKQHYSQVKLQSNRYCEFIDFMRQCDVEGSDFEQHQDGDYVDCWQYYKNLCEIELSLYFGEELIRYERILGGSRVFQKRRNNFLCRRQKEVEEEFDFDIRGALLEKEDLQLLGQPSKYLFQSKRINSRISSESRESSSVNSFSDASNRYEFLSVKQTKTRSMPKSRFSSSSAGKKPNQPSKEITPQSTPSNRTTGTKVQVGVVDISRQSKLSFMKKNAVSVDQRHTAGPTPKFIKHQMFQQPATSYNPYQQKREQLAEKIEINLTPLHRESRIESPTPTRISKKSSIMSRGSMLSQASFSSHIDSSREGLVEAFENNKTRMLQSVESLQESSQESLQESLEGEVIDTTNLEYTYQYYKIFYQTHTSDREDVFISEFDILRIQNEQEHHFKLTEQDMKMVEQSRMIDKRRASVRLGIKGIIQRQTQQNNPQIWNLGIEEFYKQHMDIEKVDKAMERKKKLYFIHNNVDYNDKIMIDNISIQEGIKMLDINKDPQKIQNINKLLQRNKRLLIQDKQGSFRTNSNFNTNESADLSTMATMHLKPIQSRTTKLASKNGSPQSPILLKEFNQKFNADLELYDILEESMDFDLRGRHYFLDELYDYSNSHLQKMIQSMELNRKIIIIKQTSQELTTLFRIRADKIFEELVSMKKIKENVFNQMQKEEDPNSYEDITIMPLMKQINPLLRRNPILLHEEIVEIEIRNLLLQTDYDIAEYKFYEGASACKTFRVMIKRSKFGNIMNQVKKRNANRGDPLRKSMKTMKTLKPQDFLQIGVYKSNIKTIKETEETPRSILEPITEDKIFVAISPRGGDIGRISKPSSGEQSREQILANFGKDFDFNTSKQVSKVDIPQSGFKGDKRKNFLGQKYLSVQNGAKERMGSFSNKNGKRHSEGVREGKKRKRGRRNNNARFLKKLQKLKEKTLHDKFAYVARLTMDENGLTFEHFEPVINDLRYCIRKAMMIKLKQKAEELFQVRTVKSRSGSLPNSQLFKQSESSWFTSQEDNDSLISKTDQRSSLKFQQRLRRSNLNNKSRQANFFNPIGQFSGKSGSLKGKINHSQLGLFSDNLGEYQVTEEPDYVSSSQDSIFAGGRIEKIRQLDKDEIIQHQNEEIKKIENVQSQIQLFRADDHVKDFYISSETEQSETYTDDSETMILYSEHGDKNIFESLHGLKLQNEKSRRSEISKRSSDMYKRPRQKHSSVIIQSSESSGSHKDESSIDHNFIPEINPVEFIGQKRHAGLFQQQNQLRLKFVKKGYYNDLRDVFSKNKKMDSQNQSRVEEMTRRVELKNKVDQLKIQRGIFEGIKNSNIQMVQDYLRFYTIPLNQQDEKGNTLLSVAVQANNLAIVEMLLNNKVDMNVTNNDGNTALHYALSYNYKEITDMLVDYGADESIRNKRGKTPWEGI